MGRVCILGGYGNFGKRIASALAAKGLEVVIAGRNAQKAGALVSELGPKASVAVFDVRDSLAEQLQSIQPKVVINTCGPFQTSDYEVAEICVDQGVHYIDLADGRNQFGQRGLVSQLCIEGSIIFGIPASGRPNCQA